MPDVLSGRRASVSVRSATRSQLPRRSCNMRTHLGASDNFHINYRGSSTLQSDPCLVVPRICMLVTHPSAGFVADIKLCKVKIIFILQNSS